MKPSTEKQKRGRRNQACLLTSCNHSRCGRAELVIIEGIELRLCPFHHHNLLKIVADAKDIVGARRRRIQRAEAA